MEVQAAERSLPLQPTTAVLATRNCGIIPHNVLSMGYMQETYEQNDESEVLEQLPLDESSPVWWNAIFDEPSGRKSGCQCN